MSRSAEQLLSEALALSEDERLEVACELIASVDGPPDARAGDRLADRAGSS